MGEGEKSLDAREKASHGEHTIRSQELERLRDLYGFDEMAREAAELLAKDLAEGRIERSREACELLANTWMQLRELNRAVEPLGCAADQSGDGNLDMRIAQIHAELEDWKEAAAALGKAIEKGGLDQPGLAHLLLGIALFNLGDMSDAEMSFQQASMYEKTRRSAGQWLRHIANEAETGTSTRAL